MKTPLALIEAALMLVVVSWIAVGVTAVFPYAAAIVWLAVLIIGLVAVPPIVRRGFENSTARAHTHSTGAGALRG